MPMSRRSTSTRKAASTVAHTTLSARVWLMFTMLMHAGKRFHHKSRLQRWGSTQPPLYPPSNSSGPTCDHEFRRDPRFDECNDSITMSAPRPEDFGGANQP